MDKRIDLFDLLKLEGKLEKVLVYPAIKKEIDPTEHLMEKIFLNPITIDAFIRNVSVEALTWKYFGNIPIGSKEIICEKRWKETIKSASRIVINDEEYKTYHDDQKGFGILERQDYIMVILEKKNV